MNTLLSFITPINVLEYQQLNKYFYNIGIAKCQLKIKQRDEICCFLSPSGRAFHLYNCTTGEFWRINPKQGFLTSSNRNIQVKDDIYSFSANPLTVYAFRNVTSATMISLPTKVTLATFKRSQANPSLASYQDRQIFITGGIGEHWSSEGSAY